MLPTQPFPQVTRSVRLASFLRSAARSGAAVAACALLFVSLACAQGSVPLVTVATDQSSLNLSNQFGVPAGTAINQAGDFAFVGHGGTALFFRAAGSAAAIRVLQVGDAVPGVAGSRIGTFLPTTALNASKVLLFDVRFNVAGDGEFHAALVTYDGTSVKVLV